MVYDLAFKRCDSYCGQCQAVVKSFLSWFDHQSAHYELYHLLMKMVTSIILKQLMYSVCMHGVAYASNMIY